MECQECGVEKLSREYPRTEHAARCEHPQSSCLRCTLTALRAGNMKCPYPGCGENAAPDFLSKCEQEIKYLFPLPPAAAEAVTASPIVQSPAKRTARRSIIIATFLSGEHCSIPYHPKKTIAQLKAEIQQEMDVAITKQKLFFGETELSNLTSRRTTATLDYYDVKPGCNIQVHVQLYEVPFGLREAVFDLSWEYPSRRRDVLDAAAFFFDGKRELAFSDYHCNHSCHVQLRGVITHSGDIFNAKSRTGRHRITVNFDRVADEVNTIFFTLSSWRAPNMGLFRNPKLHFYDKARPDEQLCENYVTRAPNSKGIVMCAVRRMQEGWVVFGIGKPTLGNAADYAPIRKTLKQLAKGYCRAQRS